MSESERRARRSAVQVVFLAAGVLMALDSRIAMASPGTHEAVTQAARDHGVPDADAEFLAARIDEIERSPKAAVPFAAMSAWRRERFGRALREWAKSFPKAAERDAVITRGHGWSTIRVIAPLFVVPPRVTDPRDADAIDRQIDDVREWFAANLGPPLRDRISKAVRSEDGGDRSLLSPEEIEALCVATIDEALSGIVLSRADDLNPGPRHPVTEAEWPMVRREAEAAAARMDLPPGRPIGKDLVEAMRKAEAAADDSEYRRLFEFLRREVTWEVESALRSEDSAFAVLSRAYARTVPVAVEREYRGHEKILLSMIDMEAIRVGDKDRWELAEANERRWVEERRKNFEDLVARSPQAQEEAAPSGGTVRGLSPYVVVNGALVCTLAAAYWIRKLNRRR